MKKHPKGFEFDEAIELLPDESVEDLEAMIRLAIMDKFSVDEDEYVCMRAVGDGWAVYNLENRKWRIGWIRNGEAVEVSDPTDVVEKTTFEPRATTGEPDEKAKGKKKGKNMKKDGVETIKVNWAECGQRFTEQFRETFSIQNYELVTEANMEAMGVDRADMLSPAGEQYLGILLGHMAVDSKINLNNRLYDPEGENGQPAMRQNAERWAGVIATAFEEKKGSIAGNVDHDGGFDGATLDKIALEFIGIRREGERVAFKAGIMKTGRGRNLLVVARHKMPIGMSTTASGVSEERTMDEENPFHFANPTHTGKTYTHITGFVLHQADAVKEPSAEVYAALAKMPREAREAFEQLGNPDDPPAPAPKDPPKVLETTPPAGPIKPAQERQEDEDMTKEELLKMFESLDDSERADLGEKLAPGLAAKIVVLEGKVTAADATIVELKDQLVDQKARSEALKEAHELAHKTAQDKTVSLALSLAADDACKAKEWGVKRKVYILEGAFVVPESEEGKPVTEAQIAEAAKSFADARSERYDKDIAPQLPAGTGINEKPVTPAEGEVKEFKGSVLQFAVSTKPAPAAQ